MKNKIERKNWELSNLRGISSSKRS